MELDRSVKLACAWCQSVTTVGDMDDLTFSQCRNRDMRRKYRHLTDPKVWAKQEEVYFKCPDCDRWMRANQLVIVNPTEPWMKELGGCGLGILQKNDETDPE